MTNIWGATSSSVSNSTLGVEGIREYRVITNSFSAEYGMTMGSQMIIVSKGGTNSFHGSFFEYLRNSALDARNFFDYKSAATQRRLPAFTRNNFGAAFGGPIKNDKTFFHGVFEGVRERKGLTLINNVIPASAKVDGGLVPVIAPVIKPLLALYPDPNLPNNRFTFPFRQPATDNYGQMRVDQNFSDKDSLFGRYTIQDTQLTMTDPFPQFAVNQASRSQFATLSENRVFSLTLLNTFRFSFSRTKLDFADIPGEPSGPQLSLVPGKPVGQIQIGGVTTNGSNLTAPFLRKQNIFTYSDDIFYTRGRHSLKFGALINHYQQFIQSTGYAKGQIFFPNITSFLLAQSSLITQLTTGSLLERTFHFNTLGFYAQDDLRVRSNLTLNLGLRYEFNTVPQEQHGQWSALRDVQRDAQFTVNPAFYLNPSLKNFSPRFGFAWDVKGNGKTAVRGGFGLLYDVGQVGHFITQSLQANPPFSGRLTTANPPVLTFPLTFPPGAPSVSPRVIDWHMRQPHMLTYNLTVERQLPFDMALTLAYAGSRGLNLTQYNEGNPTVPQVLPDGRQFWPVGAPRTNPNWGTMDLYAANTAGIVGCSSGCSSA